MNDRNAILGSLVGEEGPMYAAIRQAKAKTGTAEELARRIKEGAIPIISDVEGFIAYYVMYAPDDTVTAISVFNNYEGAEEANKRALAWIEQNLAPLLIGPATAVAGPVIVHTLA
jgi:effector-binding domain-containing protein